MALKDVLVKIKDGGLALLANNPSAVHAKVGVANLAPVGQVIALSDHEQIAEQVGTGPLADALLDSFVAGSRLIYVVAAEADVLGQVGTVARHGEGTGVMQVSGSPLNAYQVVVEILRTGGLNDAIFRFSLDGGASWSGQVTVPAEGSYAIPGTGLTLTFQHDLENPPESFRKGDTFAFSTTAPSASVESVNAAIDVLFNTNLSYDFIHVVGASDSAMWAALAARAEEAFNSFRYIHILAEAKGPGADQTVDQWVSSLLEEAEDVASTRLSICAAFGKVSDIATGRQVVRNLAGLYAGRVSAIGVQQHPGEVALGAMPSVVSLAPEGINAAHISALDDARFITFRTYEGFPGHYVNDGRIMAAPTSDYQQVETRRVVDKAARQVRIAALRFHKGPGTPGGLAAFQAALQVPLGVMQADGEIMGAQVVIPPGQNILSTGRLKARLRITPVPIMREIEVEIGLDNPFATAAGAATSGS
ncbi:MAG: DUF2586 domain-containing protein [Limnochordia bacterium]|jgi:hypothetical protein